MVSAFPNAAHNDGGALRGSSLGQEILLELMTSVRAVPCSGAGPLFVSGVLQGARLAGSFVVFDCADSYSGSLELVRVE